MNLINLIRHKIIPITKETNMTKRITSFSIPPTDIKAQKEVAKLQKYCKERHLSFSYQVIRGIMMVNKELQLDEPKAKGKKSNKKGSTLS